MSYTVSRASIWLFIILFFLYIGSHYVIFKRKEELEKTGTTKEDQDMLKWFIILSKWFPAIYLVGVILLLYMV